MQLRLFKLRFRRRLRRRQKQVEDLSLQAEAGLERNFLRRLANLAKVWRFLTAWIGLVLILTACLIAQIEGLSQHYQSVQPVPGGTYTEGIVGTFTNANPIYATTEVDSTVSHLLFSGLLTYDNQNRLVGALASSWDVNDLGTVYTVHLKPNLQWQDGRPLTADDVVFTYRAIQNPDAQSPLAGSWQGITVAKKNAYTITFTLPNPLSSFPYMLTNGIIPAHAFEGMAVNDWRSADFNSVHPIGSGPFSWGALQVQNHGLDNTQILIALKPYTGYEGGKPKLDSFIVHTFTDQKDMVKNFKQHQLTAIALPELPASLMHDKSVQHYSLLITGATMTFFNTSTGVMSDPQVRHALIQGTDTVAILKSLGFATKAVREPLLRGQLAYDPAYAQAAYDPVGAKAALDKAGWTVGADGVRSKNGVPLEVSLYTSDSAEHKNVSYQLARYWTALGAKVHVHPQAADDLQTTLNAHNYDAVLDSIAIGVDPDVFVYWDSSQTDPRSTQLNLSLYKSATADASLEAGRTRLDPTLRTIKYRAFLQAWQQDAPALGLYQPRYLYLTHTKVYGLDATTVNTGTDRLNNVQNWMIHTDKVTD